MKDGIIEKLNIEIKQVENETINNKYVKWYISDVLPVFCKKAQEAQDKPNESALCKFFFTFMKES